MTTRQPIIPSRHEIDALAVELTAELSQAAGDPEQVRAVLSAWLDLHDVDRLALIGLAVVRDTYATHLTRVPAEGVPPGALILTEGKRS